jgi:hypothetical protein
MRIPGILSISAVLILGITILLYSIYLVPASSSPRGTADPVTVIEMGPGRVFGPILEKKRNAMAASEHARLMYTIKTIHDPFNKTQ